MRHPEMPEGTRTKKIILRVTTLELKRIDVIANKLQIPRSELLRLVPSLIQELETMFHYKTKKTTTMTRPKRINYTDSIRPDTYAILQRCVEDGTARGYRRAFKHTDTPDEASIQDNIISEVMNEISEWFRFPQLPAKDED